MDQTHPDLTILIPALREEKRIGRTLDELSALLKKDSLLASITVEVLVVSAKSTDATHEVTLSKTAKFNDLRLLIPGPPLGKGRDVQYGMLRAKGKVVLFMDADLATPLRHIASFYKAYMSGGADVIIATRNLHKHHASFLRRSLSNTGNILFRIASGVWVEDSQCGFKMFSKDAAKICFSKLTIMKWGFDMEILAIARANNLRLQTKRINDWVSVPGGTFEVGFVGNAFASLKELAYIFANRIKRVYVYEPKKTKDGELAS
jgi:dolichyl-phosphate beta-glucosyltransferase